MIGAALLSLVALSPATDLDYLHALAHEVVDSSRVAPGANIPGGATNTTGFAIRVPGGTQSYYPAFWVRDAAMMLGADLVPEEEVKGWVRVIATTQPGPEGLTFPHGLRVPGYSVPDHVTLDGQACWYPGAYAERGTGQFGHLPPADDAFYFVQMVDEVHRLAPKSSWLKESIKTGSGDHTVLKVAEKAFDSVACDEATGLVICDPTEENNRVDWGFCDSIRKTGLCLMPSLLRWQAARRLAMLCKADGKRSEASAYEATAHRIERAIVATFFQPDEGALISATGKGHKDDVWGSAFAVWLHLLPREVEQKVALHLLTLYKSGGTVVDGQVREVPPSGALGGNWESALTGPQDYQNGGFWATPTGWYVTALKRVDREAAAKMLGEYVSYVKQNRSKGAPFEWINPNTGAAQNGNYGSSAGLVYISLLGG